MFFQQAEGQICSALEAMVGSEEAWWRDHLDQAAAWGWEAKKRKSGKIIFRGIHGICSLVRSRSHPWGHVLRVEPTKSHLFPDSPVEGQGKGHLTCFLWLRVAWGSVSEN